METLHSLRERTRDTQEPAAKVAALEKGHTSIPWGLWGRNEVWVGETEKPSWDSNSLNQDFKQVE